MKLLKALLKIQKREQISHIKMADILGVEPMTWWRFRTGRSELKSEYKEIVVNRWPELQAIFLSEIVKKLNKTGKES